MEELYTPSAESNVSVAEGFRLKRKKVRIVGQGIASPFEVDTLMKEAAGFRMGPFELFDLIGAIGVSVSFAAWLLYQASLRSALVEHRDRHRADDAEGGQQPQAGAEDHDDVDDRLER